MAPNIEEKEKLIPVDDVKLTSIRVGVLAIQGAFAEHIRSLNRVAEQLTKQEIRMSIVEIRKTDDFDHLDGLIIPGGESTTLNVFFAVKDGLFERLQSWSKGEDDLNRNHVNGSTLRRKRRVIFGTCAGLIFLSDRVDQQKRGGQLKLGGLDITTNRNFFGRQRQSFQQPVDISTTSMENKSSYPGVFIRAPGIASVGSNTHVLATLRYGDGGDIVTAVWQEDNGNDTAIIATAFHPELTDDLRFHELFVKMILK